MDELTIAVLEFLDRIDTCFVGDEDYTRNLDFKTIRQALLGVEITEGEGANIEGLADRMQWLREITASKVRQEICYRHLPDQGVDF